MAQMKVACLICMAVSGISMANASEFLKPPKNNLVERVSEEDIRVSLLEEVESSLGTGSASQRLSQMEALLKPIVAALPKNKHGNMGHSAVRYALHRVFVLRHGWLIKGLGSHDGSGNPASPAGVLTDQVPAYIEDLFEKRLAGKGFGLHEVAVLASTIEHLIHDEAVSRLGSAFNLYSLPVTNVLDEEDANGVLDTYMTAYILGEQIENMTAPLAQRLRRKMPDIFLAWRETQKFVQGIREKVANATGEPDDFASLARVVEEVGERFGSFQDFECGDLKKKLMNMEYRGTGRVRLSDFYKPALDGAWTFQESAGYLRTLGLLDESDVDQPSVMIANYITSEANCIASSGFYSVCCKNECEGLLGHLEETIGAHEAKPSTIATLVANLYSSTVATPLNLSSTLLQRLDEIAAGNGGMVPLHGRLFAQFMHHVYPRECPYPHMSGVAESKGAKEFKTDSGFDSTATQEEMMQYVMQSENVTSGVAEDLAVEDVSPWSSEEELFVARAESPLTATLDHSSTPAAFRSAALIAASGLLAFGFIQTIKAPMGFDSREAMLAKCVV